MKRDIFIILKLEEKDVLDPSDFSVTLKWIVYQTNLDLWLNYGKMSNIRTIFAYFTNTNWLLTVAKTITHRKLYIQVNKTMCGGSFLLC